MRSAFLARKFRRVMLLVLLPAAIVYAQTAGAATSELSVPLLEERIAAATRYFGKEQALDGSWTRLTEVSSILYSTHLIFLYEYLNRVEEKKAIVDSLMQ